MSRDTIQTAGDEHVLYIGSVAGVAARAHRDREDLFLSLTWRRASDGPHLGRSPQMDEFSATLDELQGQPSLPLIESLTLFAADSAARPELVVATLVVKLHDVRNSLLRVSDGG